MLIEQIKEELKFRRSAMRALEDRYTALNAFGLTPLNVGDVLFHVWSGMKPVKVVRVYDEHFIDVEPLGEKGKEGDGF